MRRLFWIIGAILVLSLLIGGLVIVALIARTSVYQSSNETLTVGAGVPSRNAPAPTMTAVAVTAQPLTLMPTNAIAALDTAVPHTSVAQKTAVVLPHGQQAITRPPDARDLWTMQAGGERAFARPRLYGGALVTILAIVQGAVQIRTPEGVEGWIHEPAEQALTEDLTIPAISSVFMVGVRARIVWPNGIPLRAQPDPNALKILARLAPGEEGTVQELRGDWLLIALDDGTTGWARWYYDDQRYIMATEGGAAPTAIATSGFQVAGIRIGTGDGQRVRVVVDLVMVGDKPSNVEIWDSPPPQLMNGSFNIRVRALASNPPAVRYLTTKVQEMVEVTASQTAQGLEMQVVPKSSLYLREPFFLPRDAPDSPADYDRIVIDLCFAADCPALR